MPLAIVFSMITIAGVGAGCGSSITGDMTLSEALSALSDAVAANPVLNQLTVSDLVQGFQDFAQQTVGDGFAAQLTSEQQAQLEDLQNQFDNGDITAEEFADQVMNILGDLGPGYAFVGRGMMGGPFRGQSFTSPQNALDLTDEQAAQAKGIFDQLHDDLDTLRKDAHDQILALLTSDQLTTLEDLQSKSWSFGGPEFGRMRPGGPPIEPDGFGLPLLGDELSLTDEQQAAIEQIRTNLRNAVEARHQQARDEFRAILTEEQLAKLDEMEAQVPGNQ
jgi:Spy/CpxP family protein refolding chaperone